MDSEDDASDCSCKSFIRISARSNRAGQLAATDIMNHASYEESECDEVEENKTLLRVQEQYVEVRAKPVNMVRQPTSLAFLVSVCGILVVSDVSKMTASYALRYYNHDHYPIDQTHLVAMTEGSKGIVSILVHWSLSGSPRVRPSLRFLLPSIVYMITNNIFLYALSFVTPAVWIVLVQSKVLLTLLAYRFIFRSCITSAQWTAGVLIMVAVTGNQLDEILHGHTKAQFTAILLGLLNSLLATVVSVYTEFLFKNDTRTIWEQQFQMYMGGAVLSVLAGYCFHKPVESAAAMADMTKLVGTLLFITIFTGTVQGIATATVVKTLDNIVKYQLSATCNILSSIFSALLFPDKFHFTFSYIVSLCLLLLAVYLYERKKFALPSICKKKGHRGRAGSSCKEDPLAYFNKHSAVSKCSSNQVAYSPLKH